MPTDEEFSENAVFLCGHRKSGTTLLLNLLDSHPELSVYPADSGFFYRYYPLAEIQNYSTKQKIDVMVNQTIKNLENEFSKLSDDDKHEIAFDVDSFKQEFLDLSSKSNITSKDMLISLALLYQKYSPAQNQNMWVEKTTSTEIYALDILKWFPKAKFIHLIRDPRDNWASLQSGWEKRYKDFNDSKERLLQSLLERGKLGMEFAQLNNKIIGPKQYLILKFEDLTQNPESTLKKIASFLNIEYNEILLKPTICGKLWAGNNFDGLKFKSVSNVNVNRWRERISDDDAKLIEYHFYDIMKSFEYESVFNLEARVNAAKDHYKWHNFAQHYSYSTVKDLPSYKLKPKT